jgi:hypothetical protein
LRTGLPGDVPPSPFEYERGVRYRRGRSAGVLGPGATDRTGRLGGRAGDVRPAYLAVPGQEVLTADGIGLKITIVAKYQVTDPERALNAVAGYRDAMYTQLQLALREIVGTAPVDAVLAGRMEMGKQLVAIVAPRAAEFGITIAEAEVKDVMFPGDLKKIFAQVVRAGGGACGAGAGPRRVGRAAQPGQRGGPGRAAAVTAAAAPAADGRAGDWQYRGAGHEWHSTDRSAAAGGGSETGAARCRRRGDLTDVPQHQETPAARARPDRCGAARRGPPGCPQDLRLPRAVPRELRGVRHGGVDIAAAGRRLFDGLHAASRATPPPDSRGPA